MTSQEHMWSHGNLREPSKPSAPGTLPLLGLHFSVVSTRFVTVFLFCFYAGSGLSSCLLVGHLNGFFAPRGGNLNKPTFKSSNAPQNAKCICDNKC